MGNCTGQFQNVPSAEWEEGKQTYGELIGQPHLTLDPKNIQTFQAGSRQYMTMSLQGTQLTASPAHPHSENNRPLDLTVINYEWSNRRAQQPKAGAGVQQQTKADYGEKRTREQFTSDFYDSLELDEYVYPELDPKDKSAAFHDTQYRQVDDRRGVTYLGQWKNGHPHGKGILSSNVQKYMGWFAGGLKHVHGREVYKDEVYEGQFEFGKRKGKGKLYLPDRTEEGEFNKVLLNGKITYKDGSWYQGQLKNGVREGKNCTFEWPDKTQYKGSFERDRINGYGEIIYKTSNKSYKGQFLNQLKHGQGRHIWNQGTDQEKIYEGQYQNGVKHGRGKYTWDVKNQYYFDGPFEHGKPHGQGTIKDHNGRRVTQFYYGKELK